MSTTGLIEVIGDHVLRTVEAGDADATDLFKDAVEALAIITAAAPRHRDRQKLIEYVARVLPLLVLAKAGRRQRDEKGAYRGPVLVTSGKGGPA